MSSAARSACPIGPSPNGPTRSRTPSISSAISKFAAEARKRGVDGVICGHIHHAVIRQIDGVTYVNTGDFVNTCTAIAEHFDGRLELIHWGLLEAERVERNAILALPLP